MKKLYVLILIIIMSVALIACGNDVTENDPGDNLSDYIQTTEPEINDAAEEDNKPKDKVYTWDEFQSAVTIIDLTIDNWQDYIEIIEIEETTPAEFEDEEPDIERDLYVKLKDEAYYAINTAMRFSFSEALTQNKYDADTKQLLSSSPGNYTSREDTLEIDAVSHAGSIGTLGMLGTCTYRRYEHEGIIHETILDVKDIECLKVTGKIIIFDIPEDAWNNTLYGGNMTYISYEKDGEKHHIMKDYVANALRDIFFSES